MSRYFKLAACALLLVSTTAFAKGEEESKALGKGKAKGGADIPPMDYLAILGASGLAPSGVVTAVTGTGTATGALSTDTGVVQAPVEDALFPNITDAAVTDVAEATGVAALPDAPAEDVAAEPVVNAVSDGVIVSTPAPEYTAASAVAGAATACPPAVTVTEPAAAAVTVTETVTVTAEAAPEVSNGAALPPAIEEGAPFALGNETAIAGVTASDGVAAGTGIVGTGIVGTAPVGTAPVGTAPVEITATAEPTPIERRSYLPQPRKRGGRSRVVRQRL